MALELGTGGLGFIPTIDDNQDIERDDSDSEEEVNVLNARKFTLCSRSRTPPRPLIFHCYKIGTCML